MIAEKTLAYFDTYFPILYKLGLTLFSWDKSHREFRYYSKDILTLGAWWMGLIILFIKEIFLLYQFIWVLIPKGNMAPMVMQWVFLMSYGAGLIANVLFWKSRKKFCPVFKGYTVFSREAHAEYLSETKKPYPTEDDGLVPNIRFGMYLIFLFPCSVFALSLSSLQLPVLFVAALKSPIRNWFFRIPFGCLEAYIGAYAWTGNITLVTYVPNLAQLLAFWVSQLELVSQRKRAPKSTDVPQHPISALVRTYRQLHILTISFNEVFAKQTFNIFVPAFFNQVAVNYGTIRMYEQLNLAAWAFCPYLSFSGGANLFMTQMVLAAPYECSVQALHKWKHQLKNANERRLLRSCPPLKMMYSSYKHFQKDTAPEYLDSVIDSTVTLLLWK